MTEFIWEYSCVFRLAQDTCGRYEADESARGYGHYGGCPSCVHRLPVSAGTINADDAFAKAAAAAEAKRKV